MSDLTKTASSFLSAETCAKYFGEGNKGLGIGALIVIALVFLCLLSSSTVGAYYFGRNSSSCPNQQNPPR